jgi:hypothetical protein
MATCGEIKYERIYFRSKETVEKSHLTDRMVRIKPHIRISNDIISYRTSGKLATNTNDIII